LIYSKDIDDNTPFDVIYEYMENKSSIYIIKYFCEILRVNLDIRYRGSQFDNVIKKVIDNEKERRNNEVKIHNLIMKSVYRSKHTKFVYNRIKLDLNSYDAKM